MSVDLLAEELRPVDRHQAVLTRRFLEPCREALAEELLALRLQVDQSLQAAMPDKGGKPYPQGRCFEISRAVFLKLTEELKNPSGSGMAALRDFVEAGGHARRVWGVLREQYFQNAFQWGALYIDVANDTVDPTKPKVEVLPVSRAGLRSVRDFQHYADIARGYWKAQPYPNHALPELAPLLPVILTYPDGRVALQAMSDFMVDLTRREAFRPSERYLRVGRLPDNVFEKLAARITEPVGLSRLDPDPGAGLQLCRSARNSGRHKDSGFRQAVLSLAMNINRGVEVH